MTVVGVDAEDRVLNRPRREDLSYPGPIAAVGWAGWNQVVSRWIAAAAADDDAAHIAAECKGPVT